MTIAAAEDWFVAVVKDLVGPNVKVIGGPYEFDGSFVKSLDTAAPTVVIVWDGATAADGTSLTLDATWTIYAISGWRGGDQVTRRREDEVGAWAIVTALAVHLHNRNMGESAVQHQRHRGGRAGHPRSGRPRRLRAYPHGQHHE